MDKTNAIKLCRTIKAEQKTMSVVVICDRATGEYHVSMVDPKTQKEWTFTSYSGYRAAGSLVVPGGRR